MVRATPPVYGERAAGLVRRGSARPGTGRASRLGAPGHRSPASVHDPGPGERGALHSVFSKWGPEGPGPASRGRGSPGPARPPPGPAGPTPTHPAGPSALTSASQAARCARGPRQRPARRSPRALRMSGRPGSAGTRSSRLGGDASTTGRVGGAPGWAGPAQHVGRDPQTQTGAAGRGVAGRRGVTRRGWQRPPGQVRPDGGSGPLLSLLLADRALVQGSACGQALPPTRPHCRPPVTPHLQGSLLCLPPRTPPEFSDQSRDPPPVGSIAVTSVGEWRSLLY